MSTKSAFFIACIIAIIKVFKERYMSYSNSSDFNISAACACNRGLRRANNEDNFYFDGKLMDSDNDGLE